MKVLEFKKFLILIILGVTIASCQNQANRQQTSTSDKTNCRTVEHEVGETEVCDRLQRIVVLGPYILEALLALDEQPVAYADYYAFHSKDYDNPSQQISYLGFQLVSPPKIQDSQTNKLHPISIETLPELNDADSVILLGHNFSELEDTDDFQGHQLSQLKQAWSNNAIAQSLDVSKAGRVYFVPTYICSGLPGVIGTELYLEELEQQFLN